MRTLKKNKLVYNLLSTMRLALLDDVDHLQISVIVYAKRTMKCLGTLKQYTIMILISILYRHV